MLQEPRGEKRMITKEFTENVRRESVTGIAGRRCNIHKGKSLASSQTAQKTSVFNVSGMWRVLRMVGKVDNGSYFWKCVQFRW